MVEEIKKPSPYGERLAHAMTLPGNETDAVALAEDLGVSRQAITKLLKGGSTEMTASNNARTARLLNVDPVWLAIGDGVPRPEEFHARWHERSLIEMLRQLPPDEQDEFAEALRLRFATHQSHAGAASSNPFPGVPLPTSGRRPRAGAKGRG